MKKNIKINILISLLLLGLTASTGTFAQEVVNDTVSIVKYPDGSTGAVLLDKPANCGKKRPCGDKGLCCSANQDCEQVVNNKRKSYRCSLRKLPTKTNKEVSK